jgi:BirA family biotin operon repressor/biotin-[acetyl-CoA-carboxylase] ligase
VVADAQTAGRGRRGAVWHSPPQRNFAGSVVLRPALPPEKWPRLTHACALAVCRALDGFVSGAEIKWPNDVYLSGRKVCGLLVESAPAADGGFAVAGAGVNLNVKEFPPDLRDAATSVWLERGGQSVSREDFAVAFLRCLERECARAAEDFAALLGDCTARSFLEGKRVRLLSGGAELEGSVVGAGPEGELRLAVDDGGIRLVSSADCVRVTGPADGAV